MYLLVIDARIAAVAGSCKYVFPCSDRKEAERRFRETEKALRGKYPNICMPEPEVYRVVEEK